MCNTQTLWNAIWFPPLVKNIAEKLRFGLLEGRVSQIMHLEWGYNWCKSCIYLDKFSLIWSPTDAFKLLRPHHYHYRHFLDSVLLAGTAACCFQSTLYQMPTGLSLISLGEIYPCEIAKQDHHLCYFRKVLFTCKGFISCIYSCIENMPCPVFQLSLMP